MKWCPATSARFPDETFIACMHDILQLGNFKVTNDVSSPLCWAALYPAGQKPLSLRFGCGCSGGKGASKHALGLIRHIARLAEILQYIQ